MTDFIQLPWAAARWPGSARSGLVGHCFVLMRQTRRAFVTEGDL